MTMTIHQRMVAILKALPAIGKDAQNQGLNFKFRSIDAILNELNPALEKHGVFILPEVRDARVEAKTKGYAAVVEVAYHFVAEDGSEVVAVVTGEGHDFADKAVSKAMTMAFKTCLGQVFAISTEDDPDGEAVDTDPPTQPQKRAAGRKAKAAPSPESPLPPAEDDPHPPIRERTLDERRNANFTWVKGLAVADLNAIKEKMEAEKVPMDFSQHTEEQTAWLEGQRHPF